MATKSVALKYLRIGDLVIRDHGYCSTREPVVEIDRRRAHIYELTVYYDHRRGNSTTADAWATATVWTPDPR